MSLRNKAISGAFWASLNLIGTQLINFIVLLILSRVLLPSDFGLIAMLGIFVGLGNTLINNGLTQSLLRVPSYDNQDLSTIFIFNVICCLIFYILIYVLSPFIADFYGQKILVPIIRIYCLIFVINSFAAVQNTLLIKILDFRTLAIIGTPSLLLSSSIGIVLAFSGFGVRSSVWSTVIQSFLLTVQLWYHSRWKPSLEFNFDKFRFHYHFGIRIMISGIIDVLFTNIYSVAIGKFFSPTKLGYYTRADTLRMFPVNNISSIVSNVSFPLFSSIQNDDEMLKTVYRKIVQLVVFLISPTLIFMSVLAEPMFGFLFTEKWLPAVPYFQVLCITGILYPIHSYNLQILKVKGRGDLFLRLEVIKKILVIVAVYFTLPYGIYAILYGGILTSSFALIINTYYTKILLNYSFIDQMFDILPTILISCASGGIVLFCDNTLEINSFHSVWRIIFSCLFGSITFLVLAYLFKINSLFELLRLFKIKT